MTKIDTDDSFDEIRDKITKTIDAGVPKHLDRDRKILMAAQLDRLRGVLPALHSDGNPIRALLNWAIDTLSIDRELLARDILDDAKSTGDLATGRGLNQDSRDMGLYTAGLAAGLSLARAQQRVDAKTPVEAPAPRKHVPHADCGERLANAVHQLADAHKPIPPGDYETQHRADKLVASALLDTTPEGVASFAHVVLTHPDYGEHERIVAAMAVAAVAATDSTVSVEVTDQLDSVEVVKTRGPVMPPPADAKLN